MPAPPDAFPPADDPATNAGAFVGGDGPTTSRLAVASLVFGVISVPLIVACFVAVVTAPVAIVTGHLARARVRRSAGSVGGGGLALSGLVLGYFSLIVTVALLAVVARRGDRVTIRTPGEQALREVERSILTDRTGHALGNTPEARKLAGAFASMMEDLDREAFTQTRAKVKLSGGRYVTWCELRPGRCAFVVHVPEYRRFDRKAKAGLEQIAWLAAQRCSAGGAKPGDRLAVGLKGALLFGAVMVGEVPGAGEPGEPRERGTDRAPLSPFFADDPPPGPAPARPAG